MQLQTRWRTWARFVAVASVLSQAPAAQEKRPDIYDEKAEATSQIREALARAKKENRRVLVQWGANWCGWCHLLHEHFKADEAVARKLLYEYDVVLVDIGRWDKHMDLAAQYGADLRQNGVPFLTVLDSDGKVIANQETGSLEKPAEERPAGHDGAKVLDFLSRHQAPYLNAESLLQDGLAAAQKDGKRVFLHFGAPWCGWCRRLEQWMAREDVAKVLEQDFVDVKIDIDRTIGGRELMLRYAKEEKGLPWFLFLQSDGKVLAVSEGEDGKNIGCPHDAGEIATFKAMLVKAGVRAEDVEAICSSLGKK